MTTMAEPCEKCGLLDANKCLECNPCAATKAAKLTEEIKALVREKPTAMNAYGLKSWATIEKKISDALAAETPAPTEVVQNYCAWPTCRGECVLDSRPQATQTKREPYGVLVAHKKIPNAVQEFIPMKFYGNHKLSDDYSKVTVYIKPPLSLSEEEREALETAVENLNKALNGPAQRAVPIIEALLERKE